MKIKDTAILALLLLGISGTSSASLINEGVISFTGTVSPQIPTLLTLQAQGNSTTESGCVGWNGIASVTGSCATAFGVFTGGNESTTGSGTQTQAVNSAHVLTFGVSSYANLALIVTVSQPAGSPINLTQLILSIYSPAGSVLGSVSSNCPAGGCVLNPTPGGVGNLTNGYDFQVSAEELSSLGTFSASNRVGIAASFTNATGGAETIWLGSTAPLQATPEPGSLVLLSAGLAGLIIKRRCWDRR